jgi:hypothetical protein
MRSLFDLDRRWDWEQRAYTQEIEFARSQGREDIAQQLLQNMELERQRIYGIPVRK